MRNEQADAVTMAAETVLQGRSAGPWSYRLTTKPGSPLKGYVVESAESLDSGGPKTVIAEAFPQPYPVAVNEANARLLAAAPDLLVALKALLFAHDEHAHGRGVPGHTHDIKRARAAVAKAEGRWACTRP
jgi:hypothetical protein